MQAQGYAAQGGLSPTRLSIVIAAHVAVLGAVALTPPEVIERIVPTRLITYAVPLPKVPPPDPQPNPKPDEHVTRTETIVPPLAIPNAEPRWEPPIPSLPQPQETIIPEPPRPLPTPVVVDARPDPRYAEVMQPPYPANLQRGEIEGAVTVRVLIGIDGRVKAVSLVSVNDPGFFAATERQALRYWRFKPATRDGVAIESWRTMTVRFRMEA